MASSTSFTKIALITVCFLVSMEIFCLSESITKSDDTKNQTLCYDPTITFEVLGSIPDHPVLPEQQANINGEILDGLDAVNISCHECQRLLSIAEEQLRIGRELQSHLIGLSNLVLETLNVSKTTAETVSELGERESETQAPFVQPKDCADVLLILSSMSAEDRGSGVYTVYPNDTKGPFQVFCDMETDGGGWTLFQSRRDGSIDFYRDWDNYKDGFGVLSSEHWLGNENIHRLTSQRSYELRIDLTDWEGNTKFASYKPINVADEGENYRLTLGNYHGTAGDSLSNTHSGQQFSTRDADHDHDDRYHCAEKWHGAWWYGYGCYTSNLNGLYHEEGTKFRTGDGVIWSLMKDTYDYSLKSTEMKIRPVQLEMEP